MCLGQWLVSNFFGGVRVVLLLLGVFAASRCCIVSA